MFKLRFTKKFLKGFMSGLLVLSILFSALPKVVQGYLGADTIEKFIQ
ncbi:MAG: hypothetical protein K5756_05690 [Clostridiales bacterium]|nr:hypothetical protein [Clostridiales bacterium]